MKHYKSLLFLPLLIICFNLSAQESKTDLQIDFETFTLENGLRVILHVDRSDPVVAVALTSHVGSAREIEGRTGFAHLFEHLLFLESENLGKGGLDKLSARIGGSGANGSTSRDRTNYFQTVPNDALEKMIWAEADKLGYFINTVTEQVLAKEKQVVKNEKRQGVDNRPYGHTSFVIDQNLYPKGHPYSWQVIGSLEDLQDATLQDVKDFFNQWYVPNNVVLTIAGDFDTQQAKDWVHKYFDEIKAGNKIAIREKQPVVLKETKKLYYEDNFAKLPELTLSWPSVHSYHEDSYALEILTNYLSQGKNAPFYKNLVAGKELTDNVRMYNYTSELAGQLSLQVRAFDKKDLDLVKAAIDETFSSFDKEGIPEKDLKRIKAGQETDFYNSISSVLGKGFQLAQYQIFAGDPNEINKNVDRIMSVTAADVQRVFEKYIKGKAYVATSFVPKGQIELALEDSKAAEVVEEKIVEGAEAEIVIDETITYEKTPSSFDRSTEPPYWGTPEIKTPEIWKTTLPSGMEVSGITSKEVPLIRFSIEMAGGLLLEDPNKVGVSNLLANLMTKGTKNKTPQELEEAIELLGSSIYVNAEDEKISLTGNSLARNYEATMELVQEILLEPRWDEEEFKLTKQQALSRIKQQKANPNSIAEDEFKKLIYGSNHILSNNNLGTAESVATIGMEDLKKYYEENLSPKSALFMAVGDLDMEKAVESLRAISANWKPKNVNIPEFPEPEAPETSKVYFYDVPGAKQSVIKIGAPGLAATNEDFYSAEVMNYRLGGGGFASKLTQELREGKGYTYGIRSGFKGGKLVGPFEISSGVRSNITFEAVELIKQIMEEYPENLDQNDLEVTKGFMIKSNARKFETLQAKLGMLSDIGNYNLPNDYIKKREEIATDFTLEDIQNLARKYINPEKMIYLIVGDAETQLDKLKNLGFGKPVLLNGSDM
ncbi:M16 family metallopeptidase [Gillisia limnaea]|uniref:Peptidase M16 domain protein n=1 Tax=Gillisia limnaea (strain DSM 15749 / LMG 21470 / R-8282) TaxID=865937 RepID=H2BU12_GILLR|nr:pitrilysin family protein [Gillisia limnaea]EHQ01608.1 peptidase M16 domain protein [Gillisia limnaea DSM 15749]